MKRSTPKHPSSVVTVVSIITVMACCVFHRPCHGFQSKVLCASHVLWQTPNYSSAIRSSSSVVNDDNNNVKARIVFLGTPDVAATSLETIYQSSQRSDSLYKLVGVVTQPPKRRKRGGKEMPSPVGIVAEKLGLRVLCPEKARDVDFLNELEYEIKPDLCITAAYGQYLPKRFLSLPRYGTLNIHPSLLPRWRGSSPVQRSLEAGDTTVGVTVLFTVSKMDAGPIVTQESMDIDNNEQATTLLPKLFNIGTARLIETLPKVVSGEITIDTATRQDEFLVCEAKMIDSSEGQLWPMNMTAIQCHNRVRGFSMWPGTFIYVRMSNDDKNDDEMPNNSESVKMKVIETRVLDETMTEPTNIIEIGPKKGDGLRLVCFDGSVLELLKVQPVTRNVMDAKSFVNGLQGQTVRWLSGLEVDTTVVSLIQVKQ